MADCVHRASGDTKSKRTPPQESLEEACEHGRAASSACVVTREGFRSRARTLLAVPPEGHAAVSDAATATAVLTSATKTEEDSALPWHLEGVHASRVLLSVFSSLPSPVGPRKMTVNASHISLSQPTPHVEQGRASLLA